jgi:hypothetical protein
MNMKKKKRTLADKYRVLEIQRIRDRKRLLEIAEHARKIYNITSQLEKQ